MRENKGNEGKQQKNMETIEVKEDEGNRRKQLENKETQRNYTKQPEHNIKYRKEIKLRDNNGRWRKKKGTHKNMTMKDRDGKRFKDMKKDEKKSRKQRKANARGCHIKHKIKEI